MITLYNNDCIDILGQINHIDHIVVDLPYFNIVKNEFDNQWKTLDEYLNWVKSCFKIIIPKLNDKSNIIILDDLGLIEKRIIIWARKRGFNNTRGKALASGYEPICYYSKTNNGTFNNIKIKVNSNRSEYTTGRLKDGITLADVWTDISALPHNSKEKTNHPTQKPLALMERIIKCFTNEGDTVLDFCMGSGTTGVACMNLNRDFIGIEKYKEYYDIANQRLSNK